MAKKNGSKASVKQSDVRIGQGNRFPIWVMVEGFLMQPHFRHGDMARIDVTRKPMHNDFVLARLTDGTILLRQYVTDPRDPTTLAHGLICVTDEALVAGQRAYGEGEYELLGTCIGKERTFYAFRPEANMAD